jgi:hypothetical protein
MKSKHIFDHIDDVKCTYQRVAQLDEIMESLVMVNVFESTIEVLPPIIPIYGTISSRVI